MSNDHQISISHLSSTESELLTLVRRGIDEPQFRDQARQALESMWSNKLTSAQRRLSLLVLMAIGAALAVKIPLLWGWSLESQGDLYARNFSFLVLTWVIGLFVFPVRLHVKHLVGFAAFWVASVIFVNNYSFDSSGSTVVLTSIHMPLLLWLAVGFVRAGHGYRNVVDRLDFIRFTVESFLYYCLFALAGAVLSGLGIAMFSILNDNAEDFFANWVIICGGSATFILAAWLADSQHSVMSKVAKLLQRAFTPLFALLTFTFVAVAIPAGFLSSFQRDALFGFDLLLLVITILSMFAIALKKDMKVFSFDDWAVLAMMCGGILVDLLTLVALFNRTSDLGITPNRLAILGLNLLLLGHLMRTARGHVAMARGLGDYAAITKVQAQFITLLAIWATIVSFVFPIVFSGR